MPTAATTAPRCISRTGSRCAARLPTSEAARKVTANGVSVQPMPSGSMPAATSAVRENTNMNPPKTAKKIAPIVSPVTIERVRTRLGGTSASRPPPLHPRLPPPERDEHRDARRPASSRSTRASRRRGPR